MAPFHLSLVFHNHQPVGNFDHIYADATDRAYAPMLQTLERHPRIRVALHYSGPLLDWLRRRRPDLLERVRALAGRGQIELLTSAYYEPILPIIPDADKRGQIEMMTRTVAEEFGAAADGLWLAERVWEPHLARPLADAGVRYTIVDDTHFHAAGLEDAQLLGYYVTEEEGAPLALFPSLRRLRYLIPWAPVEDVLAYLRALAEAGARPEGRAEPLDLALMGDDGEKFGFWPTTYAHCWEGGWVERFFEALEGAAWIQTVPPGEYRRTHDAAGWTYLPTATYDEMAMWALPPGRADRLARLRQDLGEEARAEFAGLVRGGFWRHFLVKYPEVNTLHHLSLRASRKAHALPPGPDRTRALDAVWSGQCNCTYWHGVFGGVYLPHIRAAAFGRLIAAEAIADRVRHPEPYADAAADDLNGDGRPEVLLGTDAAVVTVDPARGGSVVEWDDRPSCRHLGNVLTRRPESYHARLRAEASAAAGVVSIHDAGDHAKEPGLAQWLVYDRVRRATLRFHAWSPETSQDQVWRDEGGDHGELAAGRHAWRLEREPGRARVLLSRRVPLGDGEVEVERAVEVAAGQRALTHRVRVTWHGAAPLRAVLGEEWNLGVFGAPDTVWVEGAGERRTVHQPASLAGCARLDITEAWSGLALEFVPRHPADVWAMPVWTISSSEGGYERNAQGVMLVLRWAVTLEPGGTWEGLTRAAVAGPSSSAAGPSGETGGVAADRTAAGTP